MDHEEIKALLAIAALNWLEADEAGALEEHLRAGCDECESELREYREVAGALALSFEDAGAEQRIWERLDTRLASTTGTVRPPRVAARKAEKSAAPSARLKIWRVATGVAAAAAVAATIYAGVVTNRFRQVDAERQQMAEALNSQIGSLRLELTSARSQIDALKRVLAVRLRLQHVLMAPDLRLTRLEPLKTAPGAKAIVAVSMVNRSAMIEATGLPATPPGKTYELWWITKERGPIPAGLFRVEKTRGSVVASAAMPPAREHVILSAVTLEPAGGVKKPTGAMYLKGTPG